MSTLADPDSIRALVEFSYTGELTFTADNFDLLKKAIKNLKMKFIDEESLLKIEEDIEQTRNRTEEKPIQVRHLSLPVLTSGLAIANKSIQSSSTSNSSNSDSIRYIWKSKNNSKINWNSSYCYI